MSRNSIADSQRFTRNKNILRSFFRNPFNDAIVKLALRLSDSERGHGFSEECPNASRLVANDPKESISDTFYLVQLP
ncbi:hypothetical protein NDU88_002248 [Pleurodeles waltl]|uniref:Uncharacterized protein n=1 Tax=Pleurodeles waltl TaxID=8319 RepID=A0AAV7RBE9_PLEWA|nr:hypothetical protein NDU88_002248 [Pleurodeles waltl]